MSENPQTTNPGTRAPVTAARTSLAEAIAANLSEGRQEAASTPQEQPRQAQPAPEPAPKPEPEQAEPEAPRAVEPQATEAEPESAEGVSQEPDYYRLHDFAEAAELDAQALSKSTLVEVQTEDGTTEVPLSDVINGYQFSAANTQRAQKLAEERRELEAKQAQISQAYDQAQALVQTQWDELAQEEQALEMQYRSVNWENLRARQDGSFADTEAQFNRARAEIANRKQRLETSYARVMQERQAMYEKHQAEARPKAREELLRRVPAWRDENRWRSEGQSVAEFAVKKYGIDPELLAQSTDPVMLHVLHDVWRLHQQAEGVPAAAKKIAKAPRMVKPGGKAPRNEGEQRKTRELRSRLKRSGSRNDLAALLLHERGKR